MSEWQPISTCPEGKGVLTKIDDERGVRNEQPLKKQNNLWWFVDGSMYVYYRPTHWMPLPPAPVDAQGRQDDDDHARVEPPVVAPERLDLPRNPQRESSQREAFDQMERELEKIDLQCSPLCGPSVVSSLRVLILRALQPQKDSTALTDRGNS